MDMRSLIPFGRSTTPSRSAADDPFTMMRREMDRMFDTFLRDWGRDWPLPVGFGGAGFLSPKVDVAETDKGLEITAELPGLSPDEVELNLSDNVLTLKAESRTEREEKEKQYHVVERSQGTYLRRFALPFEPDADRASASFDKGVLRIEVPRSAKAEAAVHKISIKK